AGEQEIEGLTGRKLCEGIKAHGHKEVFCSEGKEDVIAYLKENLMPGDVLLTLGAGDVWQVGPAILKALST
ncbi:MAG: UDP-N-acetylmuramate--L-alanine ligase, partial [Desulfobacterales bacterium]